MKLACPLPGKSLQIDIKYIFGALYISMSVFGGVGNIISAKIIWNMDSKLKGRQLLKALVISDISVCLVCLPLQAARILDMDILHSCLMDAISFHLFIINLWFSSMTVIFIAIDRYVLLTEFQKYHSIITTRRMCIAQGLALFFSTVVPSMRHFNPKWFHPVHFFMCTLPDVVLPAMYFLIVRSMNKGRKGLEKHEADKTGARADRSKRMSTKSRITQRNDEVTRRVTLIVVAYTMCSMVATVFMFLQVAGKTHRWNKDLLSRIAFLGLAANSCWNPVVYVVGDRVFRRRLKRLFCFCMTTTGDKYGASFKKTATIVTTLKNV